MGKLVRKRNQSKDSRVKTKRWYRGFQYKGNPKELLEKISKFVQQESLTKFLPLLRLEKGAKSNKSFYFFIAVESENIGTIPQQVEQTNLFQLSFFKTPAVKGHKGFEFDEIKGMIGMAHDVQDYTNPIPYRPQPRPVPENPLISIDSKETQDLDNETLKRLSWDHEHLLYWLSASGNGTWESFKKTCKILDLSEPKRILRRLKLLKHLTTSDNGSKWQANPPSLLEIATNYENGDRTFLLHGQRSKKFLETLKMYGSVEETPQPKGEAPLCIHFTLPSQITTENLIEKMKSHKYHIKFSPVSDIPELETWRNSLQKIPGILPFKYDLKKFNGERFVDCVFQKETGFYQFWTRDTNSQLKYSFFYDENSDLWMQGDWYGLRFLAILHKFDQNLEVYCYHEREALAIPFAQRWPEVYETHLVMASGTLPVYRDKWLIYSKVSRRLATSITEKLKLTLREQ